MSKINVVHRSSSIGNLILLSDDEIISIFKEIDKNFIRLIIRLKKKYAMYPKFSDIGEIKLRHITFDKSVIPVMSNSTGIILYSGVTRSVYINDKLQYLPDGSMLEISDLIIDLRIFSSYTGKLCIPFKFISDKTKYDLPCINLLNQKNDLDDIIMYYIILNKYVVSYFPINSVSVKKYTKYDDLNFSIFNEDSEIMVFYKSLLQKYYEINDNTDTSFSDSDYMYKTTVLINIFGSELVTSLKLFGNDEEIENFFQNLILYRNIENTIASSESEMIDIKIKILKYLNILEKNTTLEKYTKIKKLCDNFIDFDNFIEYINDIDPNMPDKIKKIYEYEEDFIKQQILNKCNHKKLLKKLYTTKNLKSIISIFGEIKKFTDKDNMSIYVMCKECKFIIMCEHKYIYYESLCSGMTHSQIMEKIIKFSDSENNSNDDVIYCKYCFEEFYLEGIVESDLQKNYGNFDLKYKKIINIYYDLIEKYITFSGGYSVNFKKNLINSCYTFFMEYNKDYNTNEYEFEADIIIYISSYILNIIKNNKNVSIKDVKKGSKISTHAKQLFGYIIKDFSTQFDKAKYTENHIFKNIINLFRTVSDVEIENKDEHIMSKLIKMIINTAVFSYIQKVLRINKKITFDTSPESYKKNIELILGRNPEIILQEKKKKGNIINIFEMSPNVSFSNHFNECYNNFLLYVKSLGNTKDMRNDKLFTEEEKISLALRIKSLAPAKRIYYPFRGFFLGEYLHRGIDQIVNFHLGTIYDEDGNLHNWNINIFNDGKGKLHESKTSKDINFTFVDEKCSKCNILKSETDTLDESKILINIKKKNEKIAFFKYYNMRCPEKKMHEFDKNICKYCGKKINEEDNKYYEKYKKVFKYTTGDDKIYEKKKKIITDDNTYNNFVTGYKYNESVIHEVLQIVNENNIDDFFTYEFLDRIGLFEEKKIEEVISAEYLPPKIFSDSRIKSLINIIFQIIFQYNNIRFYTSESIVDLEKTQHIVLSDISDNFNEKVKTFFKLSTPENLHCFLKEFLCTILLNIYNTGNEISKKIFEKIILLISEHEKFQSLTLIQNFNSSLAENDDILEDFDIETFEMDDKEEGDEDIIPPEEIEDENGESW